MENQEYKIKKWELQRGEAMISALSMTAYEALHDIAVLEEYIYGETRSIAAELSSRMDGGMIGNKEVNSFLVLYKAQRKHRKKLKLD